MLTHVCQIIIIRPTKQAHYSRMNLLLEHLEFRSEGHTRLHAFIYVVQQ